MANLSIGKAWEESSSFVKRHAAVLFTIAFALMALPSVIVRAMMPATPPNQLPEIGAWMLALPVAMLLSLLGGLTISILALGREQIVGAAMAAAMRRLPALLGAVLLLVLGAMVISVPIFLIAAVIGGTGMGAAMLAAMMLLLVLGYFWVRLMVMTPVTAAEPLGPVAIIRRSWSLTGRVFWRLLGMFLLFLLLFMVVTLAVTAVIGSIVVLTAGKPDPGTLSAVLLLLVEGVVNAVFVTLYTVLIARIYAQLAPAPTTGT